MAKEIRGAEPNNKIEKNDNFDITSNVKSVCKLLDEYSEFGVIAGGVLTVCGIDVIVVCGVKVVRA